MPLTDTQCRTAKSKDKPYKLTDGNGLYLEVKPNGVKSWRYRFELTVGEKRKESVFAIGNYVIPPKGETPEQTSLRCKGRSFTLSEAREERAKARSLVVQGINPAHHRQNERHKRAIDNAITFESVAKEWLALKDWETITKSKRLNMLERVVFPSIGKTPMRAITSADILSVMQTSAKTNGPSVAAEAMRTISNIFDLAISTLRASSNPVDPVRKALPANKTQHKLPLSKHEIGQLLREVESYSGRHETLCAFKLMWLTLCRPNEAVEAEWSEFDLDNALWVIPAERMKKRKEHSIPLPKQALEMLQALKGITGKYTHLFPHRDTRTKPMVSGSFRQMLKTLGWSSKFSPHATRTTGSTRLNELGFSADWIEKQLAHTEQNAVRRTYNHAEYLANRAEMMQQWADMLDTWKSDARTKTINMDIQ